MAQIFSNGAKSLLAPTDPEDIARLAEIDGVAGDLSSHADDTENPHEVTLSQAASEQSTNGVVIAGRVYLGGASEDNKYLTASEIAQRYASAVKYKGQLKYGAMTLADMEAIETSADNHDLTTGDICGVHAEQLSYSWNGSAWNALPQGADELGDMYLIEYWYGTLDGKVYDGEVQAQIIYKEAGSDVVFDLYLDTTILLDNSVTDNKIGTRALTDAAGTDVLTPAEGKSFTAWLQGIRNNLKYALNTLLGKQNVITATGSDNVLTAPSVAGDQPGTVAKASLYGQQFAVFPDYNARSSIGTLTIPETGAPDTDWQSNTITVSQSGYIMLDGRAKVSSGFVYRGVIIINGKTVWSSDVDGVMTWVDYAQGPFPVSAGDTAQIRMGLPVASPSWSNRAVACYFVPPKVALMQASPAMANSLTAMGPPNYSLESEVVHLTQIPNNTVIWTADANCYADIIITAAAATSIYLLIKSPQGSHRQVFVCGATAVGQRFVYSVPVAKGTEFKTDGDASTRVSQLIIRIKPPIINPPLYVDGGALVN